MKIPKPKKTVELITGLHKCPGCLYWYDSNQMHAVAWRRDKIGPYTETIEMCYRCVNERHDGETGERLMYRMRELKLAKNLAKNSKSLVFP